MEWALPDNAKITVKLLILLAILVLGYRNAKKDSLPKNTWMAMTFLTVTNIVIAVIW
jgi:Tfp pilus assembly protein PilO